MTQFRELKMKGLEEYIVFPNILKSFHLKKKKKKKTQKVH